MDVVLQASMCLCVMWTRNSLTWCFWVGSFCSRFLFSTLVLFNWSFCPAPLFKWGCYEEHRLGKRKSHAFIYKKLNYYLQFNCLSYFAYSLNDEELHILTCWCCGVVVNYALLVFILYKMWILKYYSFQHVISWSSTDQVTTRNKGQKWFTYTKNTNNETWGFRRTAAKVLVVFWIKS